MRNRWFGEPWPSLAERAPICDDDAYRVATPVGEACVWCSDGIKEGERGVVMGASPFDPDSFQITLVDGEEESIVASVCASHIDCLVRVTAGPEIAATAAPPRVP